MGLILSILTEKHKLRPKLSTQFFLSLLLLLIVSFFNPSDGPVVTALAQDQASDVGQGWMDGWVAGRGSGSVCSRLAGLCVLSIQLLICCLLSVFSDANIF